MQYLISATETEDDVDAREDPERADGHRAGWAACVAALTERGVLTGAAGLQPPRASPRSSSVAAS